ncbi:hypothetical protein BJ508DRAFT_6497 [Ascobolus immersus RN42]|uniref:Uncharacterized protein n=1 Tax=Ascobolus immersus RN42 TaxID=1160509 RepID=A0A3N4IHH5_ASCIM|nr:hypothetical protein BJ508DRAFT_6497 [Ascobolus immersus RN42]
MPITKPLTPPSTPAHTPVKRPRGFLHNHKVENPNGDSLLTPPSSTGRDGKLKPALRAPTTNLPPLPQPTTPQPADNWHEPSPLYSLDPNPLTIHTFKCSSTVTTPTGYIPPSYSNREITSTSCGCCGWFFPRTRTQPYWGCEVEGCEMKRCEECMVYCGFFSDKCGILCTRYFMSYEYGRGWEKEDEEGGKARILKAGGAKWK